MVTSFGDRQKNFRGAGIRIGAFYDQSARLGWLIISDIQTCLECFDMFFCYQPSIRAKYVFATCLDGDKRLWDSSPSSVMSSSPSVSISKSADRKQIFYRNRTF